MLFISFDNNFGLKRASSKINIYFLVLLYASYRLMYAIIRFIKKPLSCKSSKPDSTAGDRVKRAGLTTPPLPPPPVQALMFYIQAYRMSLHG